MIMNTKIRIRLKAYDHKLLDQSSSDIVDTANKTGAKVVGPIPLCHRLSCCSMGQCLQSAVVVTAVTSMQHH